MHIAEKTALSGYNFALAGNRPEPCKTMFVPNLETRWKACIASIFSVSPYLICVALIVSIHDRADFLHILGSVLVIGLPAYLFISVIAWIFVGMPLFRAIAKYTSAGLLQYILVPLLLCAMVSFYGAFYFLTFGVPMVLQSAGFWFYLKKYTAT